MAQGESRMLIDGKLVDGEAGTFTNINPATEEVTRRGRRRVEGRHAPRHRRGPAGVRRDRLVDQPRASASAASLQLQDALEAEQEELREELILEVGCPRAVTHGPQLDAPLADGAAATRPS